jgi:hypothetical protein
MAPSGSGQPKRPTAQRAARVSNCAINVPFALRRFLILTTLAYLLVEGVKDLRLATTRYIKARRRLAFWLLSDAR